MAFSPAALPVQLPSHLENESIIITDQLVDSTVCPDPIPSNQITIPRPLHDLETNAFWDGPLLPCTVQNVLTGHENLVPTQLWALIVGLAITLQQREEVYSNEANHFRKHLADVNAKCHALKQCIQDIDGEPLLCLNGFEDNSLGLLSQDQMGRVLLSSSSNWTMDKWQDLVPWQEASMMLALSTFSPHWSLMSNP